MREEITPNRILGFYFVMPILIGIILSDIVGIDVSSVTQERIGLFRFLEDAGRNIQTKSMMFWVYLVFTPFAWLYFTEHRRRTPTYAQYCLDKTSTSKMVFVVVASLVFFIIGIFLFVIGLHHSAMINPSRATQALLSCSYWDISFGIFLGVLLMGMVSGLFGVFIGTKELVRRMSP